MTSLLNLYFILTFRIAKIDVTLSFPLKSASTKLVRKRFKNSFFTDHMFGIHLTVQWHLTITKLWIVFVKWSALFIDYKKTQTGLFLMQKITPKKVETVKMSRKPFSAILYFVGIKS